MYRHILVTLDGSQVAERALGQLEHLAFLGQARITLLAVAEPTSNFDGWTAAGYPGWTVPWFSGKLTFGGDFGIDEVARARWLEYLSRQVNYLAQRGLTASCEVRFGKPADEIIGFAEEQRVDAIVMATHGKSGLEQAVFGSVAYAVVRSAVAPVVMVGPTRQELAKGAMARGTALRA